MAKSGTGKTRKPAAAARRTSKKQDPDPAAQGPVEPSSRPRGMTIVGIGASAGGLTALRSFFDSLSGDTGMAFVVVTHLHPAHESHMAELLEKNSPMPAMQVTERVKVEPNHIYVIPPNRGIRMADAHVEPLVFTEPHGKRTPIDHFFRSLAKGHTESIAVILSGGGTDGAVGIKDIKEQGGLILVQKPDEAEYDSMPQAAISTGLADLVLPAGKLAEKIMEYARNRPQVPHDPGELSEEETTTLQRILSQVHARTGHDFNQYKRSTILRRVERRMQLNGFVTLEAYLDFLRHNPNEATAMFNDILIGVTNFFRDRESWEALEKRVIPQVIKKAAAGEGIRAWSIGCATGEEAYSMAILLVEQAAKLELHAKIQVFASDLDDASIGHGREGLYPAAIEADVSPERLDRFFTSEGEYYRVRRELRDMVLFTSHNALRDPPFSRQDLIVCRNVLIYLQRGVQDNVFDLFHYAMNPGGYLFLGSSESAEHLPQLFGVVDKTHRIYQAKSWAGQGPRMPTLPLGMRSERRAGETTGAGVRAHGMARLPVEEAPAEEHRGALEANAPPNVLINDRAVVLHVSDTAGRYLLQPKGPITGDLLKLVRPELQMELRTAIFRAFEKNRASLSHPIFVQFNGHPRRVLLAVRPRTRSAAGGTQAQREALVVFLEDELDELLPAEEAAQAPAGQAERDRIIVRLQAEAQRLREQLQITTEEYDSSNEEMKAANEELQSINEEYRSATEELETGKEELQSLNEELQTVNSDMRGKLDELARAHDELQNLLGATEIGVLYLDRGLRIQRFTAGMSTLFNIMPGDRGRPIGHLTHKMRYERFTEDAEQVLRSLVPLEHEVQAETGDWYLMRLRPYRTTEDKIHGVVISFVDINKLKAAEQQIVRAKDLLEKRVHERTAELDLANQKLGQARDLFLTLFDANPLPTSLTRVNDGILIKANAEFLDFFELEEKDVIGHKADDFGFSLSKPEYAQLLTVVKQGGTVRHHESELQDSSGTTRTVLASMQHILLEGADHVITTFIDISSRVGAERQVRELATSLTEVEQRERLRISQILHDDLQQRLFAVRTQVSMLGEDLAGKNQKAVDQDIAEIEEALSESIAITRSLSLDLSPVILQGEGLAEAVAWLASMMRDQHELEVTVEANGVSTNFDDNLRVLLFQAVRELLFNVVKHSGVSTATVGFERHNEHIRISVSDGGKGFDATKVLSDPVISHGLLSMQHRLNLLGCELEIASKPGKGTRVYIDCPIDRLES